MKSFNLNKYALRKEVPNLFLDFFDIKSKKQLQLFNYIKSLNMTVTCYHGTSAFIYAKMKEKGYFLSPLIMGTSDQEGRARDMVSQNAEENLSNQQNIDSKKVQGLNQIFLTTDFEYANTYADRVVSQITKGFKTPKGKVPPIKDYRIKEKIGVETDYPIVLELEVPIHLIQEIVVPLVNDNEVEKIYNEYDLNIGDNGSENDSLLTTIKHFIATTEEMGDNELTVQMLLPTKYVKNVIKSTLYNKVYEIVRGDGIVDISEYSENDILLTLKAIVKSHTDMYKKILGRLEFIPVIEKHQDEINKALIDGIKNTLIAQYSYTDFINEANFHRDIINQYPKKLEPVFVEKVNNFLSNQEFSTDRQNYLSWASDFMNIFKKHEDDLINVFISNASKTLLSYSNSQDGLLSSIYSRIYTSYKHILITKENSDKLGAKVIDLIKNDLKNNIPEYEIVQDSPIVTLSPDEFYECRKKMVLEKIENNPISCLNLFNKHNDIFLNNKEDIESSIVYGILHRLTVFEHYLMILKQMPNIISDQDNKRLVENNIIDNDNITIYGVGEELLKKYPEFTKIIENKLKKNYLLRIFNNGPETYKEICEDYPQLMQQYHDEFNEKISDFIIQHHIDYFVGKYDSLINYAKINEYYILSKIQPQLESEKTGLRSALLLTQEYVCKYLFNLKAKLPDVYNSKIEYISSILLQRMIKDKSKNALSSILYIYESLPELYEVNKENFKKEIFYICQTIIFNAGTVSVHGYSKSIYEMLREYHNIFDDLINDPRYSEQIKSLNGVEIYNECSLLNPWLKKLDICVKNKAEYEKYNKFKDNNPDLIKKYNRLITDKEYEQILMVLQDYPEMYMLLKEQFPNVFTMYENKTLKAIGLKFLDKIIKDPTNIYYLNKLQLNRLQDFIKYVGMESQIYDKIFKENIGNLSLSSIEYLYGYYSKLKNITELFNRYGDIINKTAYETLIQRLSTESFSIRKYDLIKRNFPNIYSEHIAEFESSFIYKFQRYLFLEIGTDNKLGIKEAFQVTFEEFPELFRNTKLIALCKQYGYNTDNINNSNQQIQNNQFKAPQVVDSEDDQFDIPIKDIEDIEDDQSEVKQAVQAINWYKFYKNT